MTNIAPNDRLAFARAAYNDVPLYDPKRTPIEIDLTDNTNLWGVPPSALRSLHDAATASVSRYPSLYAAELKRALATYVGVPDDMLVTGCGSDDILDSAMRAFGNPGDLVVSPEPSFAMIPIFAQMNALRWQGVNELPTTPMPQPNVHGMLATNADIVYLCSPNNPTGALTARDAIERTVRESRGMVIVDEAYAEFAGVSSVELTTRARNVLIVRTLSKAFGMAGLRVGYAIGDPALVREVEKSRGPYKVNALAEQAALAAVTFDRAWIDEHLALAISMRDRLSDALRAMGLSPLPSAANFVCVPIAQSVRVGSALRTRGVAARPFPGLPHIGDALRVTAGPWPMMRRFLDALAASIDECSP